MATFYWSVLEHTTLPPPYTILNPEWINEYTIPTPQAREVPIVESTNAEVVKLYDGSEKIIFPQQDITHSNIEIEIQRWREQDIQITINHFNKLNGWQKSRKLLKIIMHNGDIMTGKILQVTKNMLQSGSEQDYTIIFQFKPLTFTHIT